MLRDSLSLSLLSFSLVTLQKYSRGGKRNDRLKFPRGIWPILYHPPSPFYIKEIFLEETFLTYLTFFSEMEIKRRFNKPRTKGKSNDSGSCNHEHSSSLSRGTLVGGKALKARDRAG